MLLLFAAPAPAPAFAQPAALEGAAPPPAILPLRDRAAFHDRLLADRLDTLVPALMRREGVDMWIVVAREYLEDPVIWSMLDGTSMAARRRTILVFSDPGEGRPVERLTVSRYGLGGMFKPAWNPDAQPDQWKALADLVKARNPRRIAINVSPESAFADGLTKSQYDEMAAALGPDLTARLVPAGPLAIGWLETRTAAEAEAFRGVVAIAHAILAEGLSEKAVKPGVTTVNDLAWWLRERIAEQKLSTWFHPGVAVFRQGSAGALEGDTVIRPGDMIWTDFGISYLGLNTDSQHLAYVLKPGETDAPAGLKAGMAAGNKAQDAVRRAIATAKTGNDALAKALADTKRQGIDATIYSHPLGLHGHAAGPAIGFWDKQTPDERGAPAIHPDTGWSVELAVKKKVPEWGGQTVPFRLEDDVFFDGGRVEWLDGRQTRFHLIPAGG